MFDSSNHGKFKQTAFGIDSIENVFENEATNQDINDYIDMSTEPPKMKVVTLVRTIGHAVDRVVKGGADLVNLPSKWLNDMKEKW